MENYGDDAADALLSCSNRNSINAEAELDLMRSRVGTSSASSVAPLNTRIVQDSHLGVTTIETNR